MRRVLAGLTGKRDTKRLLVGAAVVALLMALHAPVHALNHFGLVDTGELFVSGDGGASWTVRSTLPVRDGVALIGGVTSSELFLASESGSFYKSVDTGLSWSAISAVPASDLVALVPYPGLLLLLTRSGRVYASADAGASFAAVGTIAASDLAGAARLGSSVVAVSRTGSVHRSTDAGDSWSGAGSLAVSNAVAVVAYVNRLYVLTATGEVARSDDLGASWSFVSTLSQSRMTALLAGPNELLAATGAGEVAASADGIAWTWRGAIHQLTVTALASDQPNPAAVGGPEPAPLAFALGSNPARGQVALVVDLEREAVVTVTVHDLAGREVARPIEGEVLPAGRATRAWRPQGLTSGLYLLSAQIGGHRETRRLAWLR